jgi:hypothetical protein
MVRQLSISRNGQELGAWPFDVVFALFRCGSLLSTDTFWIDGMDDWRPLSEAIPPAPSHIKSANFLGRDDDEMAWTFYCRDGATVIGPRPVDEIIGLILIGLLTEAHLIFIASGERWISVPDFLRMLEEETPGIIAQSQRVQAAFVGSEAETENPNWLQTGINLATVSPHIGGAYLGFNAFKRLKKWLNETDTQST